VIDGNTVGAVLVAVVIAVVAWQILEACGC
jgi:hypothetical protein